ncbi:flagellin N-terminal helical domain-containing protein [Carnobacterium alterfunditum]|uniref:flagellin N-terminal helical domain-containing protein n=1 Tax=Carnobacterium alterfunditum TaxID=28230 RepID=UPI003592FEBB
MRINTNTAAMNTYSNLTSANASKSGSLAKLSSGLRINKAGDDAAGLAISEKMKNQISGMTQASRNAQDGISLIQTAEGALGETHSILNRMRDLTVQSANDTNTADDKTAIQSEINSLTEEIDRIAGDTQFNTKGLLNGDEVLVAEDLKTTIATTDIADAAGLSAMNAAILDIDSSATLTADTDTVAAFQSLSEKDQGTVIAAYNKADTSTAPIDASLHVGTDEVKGTSFKFQIGANAGENISVSIADMTKTGLGIDGIDVVNGNTDELLGKLDDAISSVSSQRANLGAVQNRLDHTVSNLATTKENLSEANSRITDVDMAEEMMSFTKSNILSQASTSMLAQANQMPQSVLSLLQ